MAVFSNSRLNAYENCPLQYRLRYIDQVEVPRRESVEAFLGKRVHEALEFLYRSLESGWRPSVTDIVAHYREAWEREWTDAIHVVRAGETVAGYKRIGEECLTRYYRRHEPFDRGRTVDVEMLVSYSLDPDRDLHIQGYIDRLVDLGGGNYEIHDYKTARRLPTQDKLNEDRQLALYQIGVMQRFPDVRSVKLVWHYLAHDKMLESTRSPEDLRTLRRKVITLVEVIERATAAGRLPARVTPLCSWCEYKPVCPAWNPGAHAALESGKGVSDAGDGR